MSRPILNDGNPHELERFSYSASQSQIGDGNQLSESTHLVVFYHLLCACQLFLVMFFSPLAGGIGRHLGIEGLCSTEGPAAFAFTQIMVFLNVRNPNV